MCDLNEMKECQLCDKNTLQYFNLRTCHHIFCYECLCIYIKDNLGCRIKCPLQECSKCIPDQTIRRCLSDLCIEHYEKSSIAASTKKARKCLTKDCPVFVIVENVESIFECDFCKQPNCFKCNKRHYPNNCGHDYLDEASIDKTAAECMKKHNWEIFKSQFKEKDYIPNPDHFECINCNTFILPREGLIMRNCHHCCCKNCFDEYLKVADHLTKFKCFMCNKDVNDSEVAFFIGVPKFAELSSKQASTRLFCCKHENCEGKWDANNLKGFHKCSLCGYMNCLECEDIHEDMSCEKFKNSKRYQQAKELEKKLQKMFTVVCICNQRLIQNGGCGALYCSNCRRHICVFTGKLAGNNGSDSCGCTARIPCHKNCEYGCFPE